MNTRKILPNKRGGPSVFFYFWSAPFWSELNLTTFFLGSNLFISLFSLSLYILIITNARFILWNYVFMHYINQCVIGSISPCKANIVAGFCLDIISAINITSIWAQPVWLSSCVNLWTRRSGSIPSQCTCPSCRLNPQ